MMRKTIGRDVRDERAWRSFANGALRREWPGASAEMVVKQAAQIADLMLEEFQRRTPLQEEDS